jgi:hypothetical protein
MLQRLSVANMIVACSWIMGRWMNWLLSSGGVIMPVKRYVAT